MTATWDIILKEMIMGSISTMLNLLKVMIPLMITIQLLMVYNVIEKLANKLEGLGKIMGMSKNAMFPLLVALVMGVSYGAGTIIELNRANPMSKRDLALIGIFMFLCHGIIETGMLFGVAGASILTVTGIRALIAFSVTMLLARTPIIRGLDDAAPSG